MSAGASPAGGSNGRGLGREDFDTLRAMEESAEASPPGDAALAERVDALWAKASRLIDELAAGLFGVGGFHAALWADDDGEERLPFLWGRIKRAGAERFATHVGIFAAPRHCNLVIDLEKDPLDGGDSAESLEQYIDFCRSGLAAELRSARSDLAVWTDTRNVVGARAFMAVTFGEFMAANRDPAHPWPKVGYVLDAGAVCDFEDRWVAEYLDRAASLVPIYDRMIEAFGGRP